MKKWLKRICTLISIIILSANVFSAFAGVPYPAQPRWTELATYQCALKSKNGLFSNANVATTASTHSAFSSLTLTLTIQIWNGSEYIDTDNSWSASGKGATSIEKNVQLGQGNYRAKAVVNIYSSIGAYIETVTRYSDTMVI